MKAFKKFVAVALAATMVVGTCVNCFAADAWGHYFGMDEFCNSTWYEGAENASEPTTSDDGWTADLNTIGWGGIWGAQMYRSVDLKKGTEYELKCTLKSSGCDKWVFIKISTDEDYAFGKWVRLKKGTATTVDEVFTATADANQITFGFGGEFGDRESTDGTAHYAYADGGMDAIANETDEDATYSTTITCSGYSLLETAADDGDSDSSDSASSSTGTSSSSSSSDSSTVATGDFTPAACAMAAVIAAAVIVVCFRKRETE